MCDEGFGPKEPLGIRAKKPCEPGYIPPPDIMTTIFRNQIWAICPLCRRLTTLRTCYGCKNIMCLDCLTEHQMVCLHKPELLCPLCGKPSIDGKEHKECTDREAMLADRPETEEG